MNNPTGTEAEVCQDIANRQALGKEKYGMTVADNSLPLSGWINHAYEESIDYPIYLKRARAEALKLEASLSEAWGLIYAMEGQESWERAQDWLRANYAHKPPGIKGEWLRPETT